MPLPANVDNIWARIIGALAGVMLGMLCHTWEKFNYR
jgi:hypothetical protein